MEPPENRDLDVETDDATSLIDADVEGHIETQNGVDSDQRGGTTKEFLSNKGFGWLLEVDDADIDTSKSLLYDRRSIFVAPSSPSRSYTVGKN